MKKIITEIPFELIDIEIVKSLSYENKKEFLSSVILTGKIAYYEKFFLSLGVDITDMFSSNEILMILPMNIDSELLELILNKFEFPNGQTFFYNYALYQHQLNNKIVIFNYFADNYSDVMIDNMQFYERLITPQKNTWYK